MGKVKADMIRRVERTGLMHMVAQHLLKRCLEQVGCGMGTGDGFPALLIHGTDNGILNGQGTGGHLAVVEVLACLILLDIGHGEDVLAQGNGALVGSLTAHLGIEGSLIQHHNALLALTNGGAGLAVGYDGQDLALSRQLAVIAGEGGGSGIVQAQVDTGPCQVTQRLTGLTGTDALLFHERLEALLIHGHALVSGHLDGQVDGEAIGVIELKGVGAGEHGLALGLMLLDHGVVDPETGINGLVEVFFLHANDLGDISLTLPELGVVTLVLVDNSIADLIQEGFVDAQELSMTGGTTE